MPSAPNILWITTDQQRYDTVGALGNPHIHTPSLDRLCAEGTAFTHAYCQSPICTPSRASFLTGLYASTVHANINGNDFFRADPRIRLISRRLADAGYDCGLSGKLHLSAAHRRVEKRTDDGYRVFHWSHGPWHLDQPGNQYLDWLASLGHDPAALCAEPAALPPDLHQTTWCADRAIDFIAEAAAERPDTPWLFSVNVFDPHVPFDPPQEYMRRYDVKAMPGPHFRQSDLEVQRRLASAYFQTEARRPDECDARGIQAAYYAMVELIDHNVGRMVDALERTGQRERTVIIFTSDHGEMLGDHGLVAKGCRFYEGLARVPLILSWPGRFQAGGRCGALVELTDLAPTLAQLAGVELPWTHGRSLLPILDGSDTGLAPHDYVRCEYYDALDMHAPDEPRRHTPCWATMYRDRRWKLSVYHGSDYGELYDLESDPNEFHNLWEDQAAQATRNDLIRRSFDASIVIADPGSTRTGRY